MHPTLYSFRRCPFAIRARVALLLTRQPVHLREVALKAKPAPMLAASAKGTVPVLVLPDGGVIDESRAIIDWALAQTEEAPLHTGDWDLQQRLLDDNDGDFKLWLDRVKYNVRFDDVDLDDARAHTVAFLQRLQIQLDRHEFLLGDRPGVADVGIFPFVRQLAFTDRAWFDAVDVPAVHRWLHRWLASRVFADAMVKHRPWQDGDDVVEFGSDKGAGVLLRPKAEEA